MYGQERRTPPAWQASSGAAPLVVPMGAIVPVLQIDTTNALRAAAPDRSASAVPPPPVADETTTSGTAVVASRPEPATWRALVLAVWATGTALALLMLLLSLLRLRTVTLAAVSLDHPEWREALRRATRAAGVRRPVAVRIVKEASLLATWGWRTPCVLVPAAALDWPAARLDAVLRHELAHVRRHDWPVHIYARCVRAFLWWNPLAWIACRRLAVESERACDDAVLAQGVPAAAYAEHLVAVARAFHTAPPHLAIALPMARPSTLHRRIVAMLNPRLDRTVPSRTMTALIGGAVLAAVLPIAALRAAQGEQPLEGVVYDATGAVLPDVSVTLEGSQPVAQAQSDAGGRFVFTGVGPGRYLLQARLPGFRPLRQELELRQEGDWDRAITLQVGDLQETISVREARLAPPAAAPATAPTAVRVGGNIRPPRKLKNVHPVYPQTMREAGREGVVPIEAIIGRDGRVTTARVTTAQIHPDFAIAAIDAVRQWQFSPTLLNGSPVEVVMNVSISFALD